MKITEEDYWKLMQWLKENHLDKYNRWRDNIVRYKGELVVKHTPEIPEVQRQILIRILEQHPPLD